MRKVKVLHFELTENVGGIESFLLNLYQQIDREKFEFHFVTTAEVPAYKKQLEELGGFIHVVSKLSNVIRYASNITELLRDNYDIIHIHKNSAANIIPFIEAKKNEVPLIIVHSHNTAPSKSKLSTFLHFANKYKIYKYSDIHLACSDVAGKWMYGDKSYEVIRNGIITKRFLFDVSKREKIRRELKINAETFVVGNVGRFAEQKNHQRLIRIFANIYELRQDSCLLLIGEGTLREKIEAEVEDLGLSERVKFLGSRADVVDLLMGIDAFVMPSLFEGLPVAGVEAQAAGTYLYLADTISKQIEISKNVTWFSLEELDRNIAKIIVKNGIPLETDRIKANDDVVAAGYDMSSTCKRIEEIYIHEETKHREKKSVDYR